jgi:hypothetical protein
MSGRAEHSRSATSSNEAARRERSTVRQSRTTPRSDSGSSPAASSMLSGWVVAMATINALKFLPEKQCRPHMASKNMAPNAKMSVRPSMSLSPRACSGLI